MQKAACMHVRVHACVYVPACGLCVPHTYRHTPHAHVCGVCACLCVLLKLMCCECAQRVQPKGSWGHRWCVTVVPFLKTNPVQKNKLSKIEVWQLFPEEKVTSWLKKKVYGYDKHFIHSHPCQCLSLVFHSSLLSFKLLICTAIKFQHASVCIKPNLVAVFGKFSHFSKNNFNTRRDSWIELHFPLGKTT